ncbi:MAG: DUF1559 domain-containing protein, partial [Gemmatimonadales bacterium]|nr:DUF1559 domain-containing protein [Gemmatimonadales bacterium]
SMVFPVFARARESARKAVCLSNVKNIALAFQMYLADNNDTLPPAEHREEVKDYFDQGVGTSGGEYVEDCYTATSANPYLRWPVIVDEYVKNRDVWRCPSHKLYKGAAWIIPGPDWFTAIKAAEGAWPESGGEWVGGPCETAYPPGWGGVVTDSLAQLTLAMDPVAGEIHEGVFLASISVNGDRTDMKLAEVEDPVQFWICGDGGAQIDTLSYCLAAYPDICCLECSGLGWTPDWEDALACGYCDDSCL